MDKGPVEVPEMLSALWVLRAFGAAVWRAIQHLTDPHTAKVQNTTVGQSWSLRASSQTESLSPKLQGTQRTRLLWLIFSMGATLSARS